MTIGEASAVNNLLRYFLGSYPRHQNELSFEDARSAAGVLARSAHKALMAGIDEKQAHELMDQLRATALRIGVPFDTSKETSSTTLQDFVDKDNAAFQNKLGQRAKPQPQKRPSKRAKK